jgi:uridine kinase
MDRDGLVRAIASARASSAFPVLVAIDGRSGSGKSTLAAQLAAELGASVVSGDDFYRPMDHDERRGLHAATGAAQYFDWQRLRAEALVPLRGDRPAVFRPYDWAGESHVGGLADELREIESRDVILIDGVYSARTELADLVDLAVLVEVDRATRLRRLAERSHDNAYWHTRWESAEAYYFSTLRPPETFDALILGT